MGISFSRELKEIISYSYEEAAKMKSSAIDTGHMILGMIKQKNNSAVRILESLNVDLDKLAIAIEEGIQSQSQTGETGIAKVHFRKITGSSTSLALTVAGEKILHECASEARLLKSNKAHADHLLIAVLKSKDKIYSQIINQLKQSL